MVTLQDCPDQFQFVKNLVGRLDHEVWSWAFPTLHWCLWICYQFLLFSFLLNFVCPDACILGVVKLQQRMVFHIILLASCFYLAVVGFRLYVGGGSLCHLPWIFRSYAFILLIICISMCLKYGLDLELVFQIKHPFQFNFQLHIWYQINNSIQFTFSGDNGENYRESGQHLLC